MKYKPELGIFGNLKRLYERQDAAGRDVFNERGARAAADAENREAVEQSLTDLYLDGIQAQQDITEIQLQMLEVST